MGHLNNILSAGTGSGVAEKTILAWGKIRRAYLGIFGGRYVAVQEKLRQGECIRCGTCCKLLYQCPHLEEAADGLSRCKIHENRPVNCRIFPVNRRDLQDRDLLAKDINGKSCGFWFAE